MNPILKIFLVLIAFLYFCALGYVIIFSMKKNIPEHADAIVVLGARLKLNNNPSASLYYRSLEAASLYKKKKADYVIVTGGVGVGSKAESAVAKKILLANGVPGNKILGETLSHNTYENIRNVTKISKSNNIKSIIIVSDSFHVGRGVYIAKHAGFHPVYWDFPDEKYFTSKGLYFLYAREAAAMFYYVARQIVLDAKSGADNIRVPIEKFLRLHSSSSL